MSFRNYNDPKDSNIKIEQNTPSELFLSSKFPTTTQHSTPEQEIIAKVADIIVGLHESLLLKCQHLQIFRDLTPAEQNLLLSADKNTALHTALAGALAIDSCLRSIDREQQFVGGNLLRANSALITHFQTLQKLFSPHPQTHSALALLNDALKFVTQQMQALPASRGREHELQKQLALLQNGEDEQENEWNRTQGQDLLSEMHKENQMLKLAIKEKESYITTLEGRLDRAGSKLERNEERRNSYTTRLRMQTEKNTENENASQMQLAQEQVARLREQLQEKGKIVFKMNEQFASEMQKYNSVFRRLEEQNRILKKYNDVDAAYLLEELEMEIDLLREQKRKDQLIITDIQRRLEGFSFNPRPTPQPPQRQQYQLYQRYEQPYPEPMPQPSQYFERTHLRPQSKYYSPNYTSRVMSPFQRQPYREQYLPAETYRTRASRREEPKNKSRSRYQGLQESRESREPMEAKSTPTINLLERVMSKRP